MIANPLILFGGPCESRTRDQRIKSPLLYQTELTAQRKKNFNTYCLCCQNVFALSERRVLRDCSLFSDGVQDSSKMFSLIRSISSGLGR